MLWVQMSTHNICLYKEVKKKNTGCNLKTTEFLDRALIGICAVIRLNKVITKQTHIWNHRRTKKNYDRGTSLEWPVGKLAGGSNQFYSCETSPKKWKQQTRFYWVCPYKVLDNATLHTHNSLQRAHPFYVQLDRAQSYQRPENIMNTVLDLITALCA